MNFLENLERLLQLHDMKKSELARKIGVAPSTIRSWYTNGCGGVALKTLLRISSLFNISLEELVNGNPHALQFSPGQYSESELKAIKDFSDFVKSNRQG